MIDAFTIRLMRSTVKATHIDACMVFRKTGESNTGGIVKPLYDAGTATKCRWHSESGTRTTSDGKVVQTFTSTVAFAADVQPIRTTDYLVFDGRSFSVLAVPPLSSLDAELLVTVQERKV